MNKERLDGLGDVVYTIVRQVSCDYGYNDLGMANRMTRDIMATLELRALPDDSPTVLTRETIIELARGEIKKHGGGDVFSIDGEVCDGDDVNPFDYERVGGICDLRDALLARLDEPVGCPTGHKRVDGKSWLAEMTFRPHRYMSDDPDDIVPRFKHCPDCGARLQEDGK